VSGDAPKIGAPGSLGQHDTVTPRGGRPHSPQPGVPPGLAAGPLASPRLRPVRSIASSSSPSTPHGPLVDLRDLRSTLAELLGARYVVERELGAGGMATVFLAHDSKHDRDVAIKVLHPELGAVLGADRFLSEIRTTARLQHPHILPLLDSGDAGGLLYYVMPLVTGETLRTRLERERQLPVADAVLITREVADALGYAHGLGVIHRDIKPENILLQGGHALVADFGIALAVQSAGGARMTQTGLSLGTPQYMSPEQAMGERTIDARSDIYALGVVTYEMLTGQPPFTGSTVQAIVARVMTEKPAPIATIRDTVPPHVEHAVVKALAKLPADRFATAAAFSSALDAHSTFASDLAATAGSRAHPPRSVWNRVRDPLAVASVAVALVVTARCPSRASSWFFPIASSRSQTLPSRAPSHPTVRRSPRSESLAARSRTGSISAGPTRSGCAFYRAPSRHTSRRSRPTARGWHTCEPMPTSSTS
jgi:serine/threonine protein kinase